MFVSNRGQEQYSLNRVSFWNVASHYRLYRRLEYSAPALQVVSVAYLGRGIVYLDGSSFLVLFSPVVGCWERFEAPQAKDLQGKNHGRCTSTVPLLIVSIVRSSIEEPSTARSPPLPGNMAPGVLPEAVTAFMSAATAVRYPGYRSSE